VPSRATPVDITQEGAVVGSPLYIAPEQARGHDIDQRADMYALGASFHHLVAGRPPFTGTTGLALVAQHLTAPAPGLQDVAPHVPKPLAAIVDRLLEKSPRDRFADYDELLDALHAAAPDRPAYAGFWTRGAAVLIDSGLAGGLIATLGAWEGLVIHGVYVTLAHARFGQTLAKYFLRIRVHRPDGSRLGIGRSALRTVIALWAPVVVGVMILYAQGAPGLEETIERLQPQELEQLQSLLMAIGISNGFLSLLYGAGLAMAAFHPTKRAIHDLVVGSVVTYRLPGGASPEGEQR
jgi:uncharacterized RDD family membrane protein YckC